MLLIYIVYIVIHFLVFNIMKKALSNFTVYGVLLFAAIMVYWMISNRERFGVPEFLDRSNQDRTIASWHSSYEQKTNNLRAADHELPAEGQSLGVRVGLFEAHNGLFH